MNKYKILGCIGGAVGLFGIGYAVYNSCKVNTVCEKLNSSIDEMAEDIEIDIPEAMVESAVKKSVDREVRRAISMATEKIVKNIKLDIHDQIKTAVDTSYSDLKDKVSIEISKQVANIDIKEIKDSIRTKAEEKILERFDGDLDDLLEKHNRELDRVNKIYKSIADSMASK